MTVEPRTLVRLGEMHVARGHGSLAIIGLGSCVAILLYDGVRHVAGLAHPMLPDPANGRIGLAAEQPGRFATTAVPALVEAMRAEGAEPDRLQACLAGGASMFADLLPQGGRDLGMRNVAAARRSLGELGIAVRGEDVGGSHGRTVQIEAATGRVLVRSVLHADVVL